MNPINWVGLAAALVAAAFLFPGAPLDVRKLWHRWRNKNQYLISIDIGTTTLTGWLGRAADGKVLAEATVLNSQRQYGADVLSRTEAALDGAGGELQALVRSDLLSVIDQLLAQTGVLAGFVKRAALTGNTTMMYLLFGLSCESLARAPFVPAYRYPLETTFWETLSSDKLACPVHTLPYRNAFFGGDAYGIVSTIDDVNRTVLVLDLGTNCELALLRSGTARCATVPAGPAFEGAELSCGVSAMPGAIVRYGWNEEKKCDEWRTIGDMPPIGLCGSGLVDLLASLVDRKIIDETGRLQPPHDKDGYTVAQTPDGYAIKLTQADIRALQLAKGAVAAAVEFLMTGTDPAAVDLVLLCGNMGLGLDVGHAIDIGLLPDWARDKVKVVPDGALRSLHALNAADHWPGYVESDAAGRFEMLALETDPAFQDVFAEKMLFKKNK